MVPIWQRGETGRMGECGGSGRDWGEMRDPRA